MSRRPWQLSRRTWLRGAGVVCALPYLEAMTPTTKASARSSHGDAPKRLCFLYVPNGVSLPPKKAAEHHDWNWFPEGQGLDCRFTKVLKPLEPLREHLTVLGGFSHPKSRRLLGHLAGDTWLTGGDLRGSRYLNSISADQVAARQLGLATRYPSLALSTDGGIGYKSRISTLSFGDGGRPIPSEHNQRAIFERYFSPDGQASTDERQRSLARGKKIVDLIKEDARSIRRRLGANDEARVDEYLDSLSDIERGIARSESWLGVPLPEVDSDGLNFSVTADVDPQGYLQTMLDLIVLSLQTDLTRVVTYMMAREDGMGLGENFPKLALGLNKGHHTISHDKTEGHWAEWGAYDRWLATQVAYFIDRLRSVHDENGPLLDNSLVLYGSACSSTHNAVNYPLVLAGGSRLGVKHKGHVRMEKETPMSNLLLGMLQTAGVNAKQFSDSTESASGFLAQPPASAG